jgi:hypothetical protein
MVNPVRKDRVEYWNGEEFQKKKIDPFGGPRLHR